VRLFNDWKDVMTLTGQAILITFGLGSTPLHSLLLAGIRV